ncbi:class I SAM-dependent methyltransferase [Sphingomonas prati]|uniref:SAM-dependent methyltransferase n=1 Tax=Sphingomonas prati TaxID=1843237 RepID=A0A7W9BU86_9SPHN|nr:class I SAM-dependent methyltransferase [Sphingomonas prati]MBB5730236.1 SAM-dependent methyltransferase [Sphingomonas prati]GGE92590.1 putative methyltransferase [Sphingomonas prati]
MSEDSSAGWEAVATRFARIRSNVGTDVIAAWSDHVRPAGTIVDIGCGTGEPIARTLVDKGFDVYGIDPAPTLLAAFRRNFLNATVACEPAEASRFFNRRFDGAVAIGLIFLLPEDAQRALIDRVGGALEPGGHFLFSAPRQVCCWTDSLTGRPSSSLGETRYREYLTNARLRFVDTYVDEGSNTYFHAASEA